MSILGTTWPALTSPTPDVGRRPTRVTSPRPPRPLRQWLLWPALFAALLHVPTLAGTLSSDEGGYAMIARWLSVPGDYLYNSMWVDRPPALVAVFKVATALGPHGTRVVAGSLAVVIVVTLGLAARRIGGDRAAAWTGWIACALAGSTLISAQELNGELIAVAFVSCTILTSVHAVQPRGHWRLAAAMAGAAASTAALVKQDFVDGFAFIVVFTVLSAHSRRIGRRRALQIVGWSIAGAGVPAGAALSWAWTHGGVDALVYAMYGFRMDASSVIGISTSPAVSGRMREIAVAAVTSGIIPLAIGGLVLGAARIRRLEPFATALAAAGTVEVIGVVGGQNYWVHYLVGLIPPLALAGGLIAARRGPMGSAFKGLSCLILVSAVVTSPVSIYGLDTSAGPVAKTSQWLHDSAAPGDTLTTLFSHASINYLSGLRPAYPYAWSLPVRVRDPQLTLLSATLDGPNAPTWVLGWEDLDTWHLDGAGNLTRALGAHYRPVATVCSHTVWLHDGVERTLKTPPQAGEC